MRNIFDQYEQRENRLTHALACTLQEDPRLLRGFVKWVTGTSSPKGLRITEQAFPGEAEDPDRAPSIPDAWIYGDSGWALLIEAKLQADIGNRQLERHIQTARRHGFGRTTVLLLTARRHARPKLLSVAAKTWVDLYGWLNKQRKQSPWARRLMEFLEISEARFVDEEHLIDGALTMFSGIPFSNETPYSYTEAKRLIRLAMPELRKRRDLKRELGMDPEGQGRGAITGTKGGSVWDFLPLKAARAAKQFTNAPHLTMGIQQERLWVGLTVPDGLRRDWRRRLTGLAPEAFRDLMSEINERLVKALRGAKGAAPWVELVQRHFKSQRSRGIEDAKLEFDLRTGFSGGNLVKGQPQWLDAAYAALVNRRSNMQLIIGASFSYEHCKKVHSPEILDYVSATWIACKPLLSVLSGRPG